MSRFRSSAVLELSAVKLCKIFASDQQYHMGEVILEKGEVLKVYFVCATAVQSQLFSFADLILRSPIKGNNVALKTDHF